MSAVGHSEKFSDQDAAREQITVVERPAVLSELAIHATGTLLEDSLIKLCDLIDRSHPEMRPSSGMTVPLNPLSNGRTKSNEGCSSWRGAQRGRGLSFG